jgi:hypothetical protein
VDERNEKILKAHEEAKKNDPNYDKEQELM